MTRKDFILISSAIRRAIAGVEARVGNENHIGQASILGIKGAALELSKSLLIEHGARFDDERFMNDCGFGGSADA